MTRLRRAFGVTSASVARDPALSLSAKALYLVFCTYADDEGVCYPSNETLSNDLGVSDRTIRTLLAELCEAHVIVRQVRYDNQRQINSVTMLTDAVTTRVVLDDPPDRKQTSIREEAGFPLGGEAHDLPGGEAGFLQNKTSKNKTSKNNPPTPHGGAEFEEFWALYPRKEGKGAARKAWDRLPPAQTCAVLDGLRAQLPDMTRKERKYQPMPATWLSQSRWEDEVITTPVVRREIHPR